MGIIQIKVNEYITEHFKLSECVCPCCDMVKIIPGFYRHMELLESMRQELGFPIVIKFGYMCPDYLFKTGKNPRSWHGLFATDVNPSWENNIDENEWLERLEAIHLKAIELEFGGIGEHETHIHLDMRPDIMRWRG